MKLIQKSLLTVTALLGLTALTPAAIGAALPQEDSSQAKPAAELPTAREIVDRYLKVTGIAAFAPKYKSQKMIGTIELVGMGVKGTTETITMKPSYTLSIVKMDMVGEIKSGDDGEIAWRIHPMMGETILEGIELEQMRSRSDAFESAFKRKERYETMETVGKETFDGKECYKVRFVEKPYESVDLPPEKTAKARESFEYYEVETGLQVGITMVSASPQGEMPTTATMSDYKQFGEVKQPAKSVISVQGMKILAVTESIVFNEIEDASIFDPPASIKKLAEKKKAKEKKAGGEDAGDGK